MRFRSAHASHTDWSTATEECLLLLSRFAGDERYGRQPNLGFVYLTEPLAPHTEQILTLLKSRTGIPNWVGTTGVGIAAAATEYTDEPALAVMLGQFAAGSFNVFSGTQRPPTRGMRTDSGAEAAFAALVHADPQTPDLSELIVDMADKVTSGYLFGGLSSGRGTTHQVADRVLTGGLSGVVFASDVPLVSRVTQGVHPLVHATRHTITRSTANFILELDGRPAFDVLLEDTGIRPRVPAGPPANEDFVKVREQLRSLGLRGLFVGLEPAAAGAYHERRRADRLRPDYMVRPVVAIDPGKGVVAVGAPVEDGQGVSFCTRDESAARKDLIRICAEIRDHLHEAQESSGAPVEAKGAVYVSCVGRGSHLFGEQHEELRIIQQQLGDVPLVGFYASGEIGAQNLYGFTGVLTVFY
ncbi:MAG: FIST C-terminal domain-containing protein [Burkholderiales bacterium]|nr:FIST C-terminal domain-containing protein [Burkholderiales bacterium]